VRGQLDANQRVVDGVILISKDTHFFQCACDYRFFFYDSLESLSLPFDLVELAPLYFYGMPQEADLFLRYVMSDDGNTLVEELGTLSYKPKGTSLTEIPSFRFFNWGGETASGRSFALEFDGSFVPFDVRLWRKRIYELDDDKFEEGSYHPYLDGWERVIRKVRKVPDEYAYRRMVAAVTLLNSNQTQEAGNTEDITQRLPGGDHRAQRIKLFWSDRENIKGFANLVNNLLPTWRFIKGNVDWKVTPPMESRELWLEEMLNRGEVKLCKSKYPRLTKDLLYRAIDYQSKRVDREPIALACYHAAFEFTIDDNDGEPLSIIEMYRKFNAEGKQPAPTTLVTYYRRGLSLLESSE
jgi:hypothetical protein